MTVEQPSEAKIASLLARAQALRERVLAAELEAQQRAELEAELAEIGLLLESLGYRRLT